jgi:ABC-type multidrug transport system permease subunit
VGSNDGVQAAMKKDWRFWAFVIVLALVAIAVVLAITTLVAPVPQ